MEGLALLTTWRPELGGDPGRVETRVWPGRADTSAGCSYDVGECVEWGSFQCSSSPGLSRSSVFILNVRAADREQNKRVVTTPPLQTNNA